MSPYGMKWMVVSEGGVLSNTDAHVKSTFSRALWSGWHLTSYTMVLTRWGELPKPAFFVDGSKAGKVIWFLISSSDTFGWPSVLRFLEVVFVVTNNFKVYFNSLLYVAHVLGFQELNDIYIIRTMGSTYEAREEFLKV